MHLWLLLNSHGCILYRNRNDSKYHWSTVIENRKSFYLENILKLHTNLDEKLKPLKRRVLSISNVKCMNSKTVRFSLFFAGKYETTPTVTIRPLRTYAPWYPITRQTFTPWHRKPETTPSPTFVPPETVIPWHRYTRPTIATPWHPATLAPWWESYLTTRPITLAPWWMVDTPSGKYFTSYFKYSLNCYCSELCVRYYGLFCNIPNNITLIEYDKCYSPERGPLWRSLFHLVYSTSYIRRVVCTV